jgi:hypothetical protein
VLGLQGDEFAVPAFSRVGGILSTAFGVFNWVLSR